MALQTSLPGGPVPSVDQPGGAPRYLARQPILDKLGRAHGYELLFRAGPESSFRGDAEQATRMMIDNAIVFGLRKLTGGAPAFVNCTAESLIQKHVRILPPGMAVLEILETLEPAPDLVAACRELKAAGYKLALDDFVYRPALKPLIQLADYIKVDWLNTPAVERLRLMSLLKNENKIMVAEKIETQADFEKARSEGFTLFQGYYFCRPVLLSKRQVPANKLAQLRLLGLLQQDPLDLTKVTDQVKVDPFLTYRLLRLVNSPLCSIREEVRSIQTALMVIGDDMFRHFATLAILTEINSGKSTELLRTAFVRARFCELASDLLQLDPKEQYLAGLFSLLAAMLQTPMDEAVNELPLRDAVRKALLGEPGTLRLPLEWLECQERANWLKGDQIAIEQGLQPAHLQDCFTRAVLWADETLAATIV